MAGWLRNVVSHMQRQVQRRRQQTYSRQINSEEAGLSKMQAHLSDIGSIRDLQAHRAETEAKAKENKKGVEAKNKKT